MKVVDLTGKTIEWKAKGYVAGDGHRTTSGLHALGREAIQAIYPTITFKEEVPIPTGRSTLFLDFYIPVNRMAIEVHGQQHYKFNLHFHQSRANYISYKQRDEDKARWCEINGIHLIILPYNEDIDEWKLRLHRARCGQNEQGDEVTG